MRCCPAGRRAATREASGITPALPVAVQPLRDLTFTEPEVFESIVMASDLRGSAAAQCVQQCLLVCFAPLEVEMPMKAVNAVVRLPCELSEAKVETARAG